MSGYGDADAILRDNPKERNVNFSLLHLELLSMSGTESESGSGEERDNRFWIEFKMAVSPGIAYT